LRIGGGPSGLRRLGILYRGGHLRLRGEYDAGAQLAGHRLKHVARPSAGALDLLAADKMAVLDHGSSPRCARSSCLMRYHALAGPGKGRAAPGIGPPTGAHGWRSRSPLIWVEACLSVLSEIRSSGGGRYGGQTRGGDHGRSQRNWRGYGPPPWE